MRVKHLWDVVPLPSRLRLAYSRVTLNFPTTVFFMLALVQCVFQVSLHVWLYTQHQSAHQDVGALALNATSPIAVHVGDSLLLCKDIPTLVGGPDKCTKAPILVKRTLSAASQFDARGNLTNVKSVGSNVGAPTVVTQRCIDVLPWASQSLRETDREVINFILYHTWLFWVCLTAILNQSIPHLIATLAAEALCAIGSAFRIMQTSSFQDEFKRFVVYGSCDGTDLIGTSYFQLRRNAEIAISAVNAVALIAFIALSWHLIKIYGQRSFERVNKRPEMSRLYIVILTTRTCIQVAVFYMVAAIGLFVDQLTFGPLRDLSQCKPVYLAIDMILLVLIVPWMILGWTFGRMESKPRTLVFMVLTIMFMAVFAAMFTSPVHRLLMITWNVFAMTNAAPMVLLFVTLLLAIYSWFHLDLGLAEYLKAEEPPHPADKVRWSLAVTSDPEKGSSPLSKYGSTKPNVIWIHPPSPIAVRFPTATQVPVRSDSTSSVSVEGGKVSSRPTGSRILTKSRSVPSRPDPYSPPPGIVPPSTMASVPTAPKGVSDVDPPSQTFRNFPTLLDAVAFDWVRHRVADDDIVSRPSSDTLVFERPLPSQSFPSSVKPSQTGWL